MPRTKRTSKEVYSQPDGKLEFGHDKNIYNFVSNQIENRGLRDKLERQWYMNIAYYLGHQYLQWDPYSKKLYLPQAPRHRQRIVINRLMPIVRRIISATLRGKPQWIVSPATTEVEDQITSKIATDYLKSQWRNLDMEDKLVELVKWRSICGNAFLRCFWDPAKGEKMVADVSEISGQIPGAGNPLEELQKMGKKTLKKSGLAGPDDSSTEFSMALGDVEVEVVSPFNICPDPDATSFDKARWLIDSRQRHRDYVKEIYGLSDKEIGFSEDSNKNNTFHRLRQVRNLTGPAHGDSSSQESKKSPLVDVHTVWVRPTAKEPTGWWATVVNDRVIRKARNQPGFPTFPYQHVQEIAVPGRLWGTCALEQSIPVQVAYNRARSQVIEHVNTITRPAWLIPKGGGINDSAFTGEPGERIKYTWPMKPELSRPGDLPSANHHNTENLIRDIEDVSSQHEAQQGQAPGRVESGVGLASLMEQDDSILAPASQMTATALGEIGACILKMASVMVDEERLVRIVGQGHAIDVRHFKGQDLTGQNSNKAGVNYFDVKVEMGSNMPMSAAARRELAMALAQFGILNPQEKADREKILELLELNRDPSTITPGQMDISNARYENVLIMTGKQIPVNTYDDDELHVSTHREFQKSAEYRRLLEKPEGEQINKVFEMHISQHENRLRQQMMGAMMPGAGGPPQPGAGGGQPDPMQVEAMMRQIQGGGVQA